MTALRLVVTGSKGQVARSLIEQVPESNVEIVTLDRARLDLNKLDTIDEAVAAARPDVLVSAAAYTDVEAAESDPDRAETINASAAGRLAACAYRLGIPIIHLSTDYVFDGRKPGPYQETDPINPLNAYGRSKANGERSVAHANPAHVILRTCWVYSPFGRNFVRTMLELGKRQQEARVVSDQVGNPTAASDIADSIVTIARTLVVGGDRCRGTFHMASAGEATWADFAAAIFALASARGTPSVRLVPVSSAEYQTRARRPSNSRLDCSKLTSVYGIALPHWRTSLPRVVDRILEESE